MAEPPSPTSRTNMEVAIHTAPLPEEATALVFVEANAHVRAGGRPTVPSSPATALASASLARLRRWRKPQLQSSPMAINWRLEWIPSLV